MLVGDMARDKLIAIVDDDAAVRDSLVKLLEAHGHGALSFEGANEFLQSSACDRIGSLILDLSMPGMSGLDLIRALNEKGRLPPTVVVTGHGTVSAAVEAMKLGALDFLEKPYNPSDLLKAIAELQRLPSEQTVDSEALDRIRSLPPRQLDVLAGLMKGLPNKLIAYELGLSVRTVEHYRAELMARAGARNLSELIRMGVAAGL